MPQRNLTLEEDLELCNRILKRRDKEGQERIKQKREIQQQRKVQKPQKANDGATSVGSEQSKKGYRNLTINDINGGSTVYRNIHSDAEFGTILGNLCRTEKGQGGRYV